MHLLKSQKKLKFKNTTFFLVYLSICLSDCKNILKYQNFKLFNMRPR